MNDKNVVSDSDKCVSCGSDKNVHDCSDCGVCVCRDCSRHWVSDDRCASGVACKKCDGDKH
jgi:hypothetical protein